MFVLLYQSFKAIMALLKDAIDALVTPVVVSQLKKTGRLAHRSLLKPKLGKRSRYFLSGMVLKGSRSRLFSTPMNTTPLIGVKRL